MRKFVAWALILSGLFFATCWLIASSDGYVPRLSIALNVIDYRLFIKKCIVEATPYHPASMASHDACYLPIAYCLVKCFPLTPFGEAVYVTMLVVGLLGGVLFFLHQRQKQLIFLFTGAVVLTVPFASGPIKGNPSAWAAGATLVFLAWFDASATWKRAAAAIALAFAVSLKITPLLFGLLYLRGRLLKPDKWPKEDIFVAAFSFALLFSLPFLFFGGPNEVETWLHNAIENSRYYSREADFGLLPVARFFGHVLPRFAQSASIHLTTLTALLLGIASCFAHRFYHALALIGVAMVFLCHHDYGTVYMLPAFAIWLGESKPCGTTSLLDKIILLIESLSWFLVFEPILCVHSYRAILLSNFICNGAIITLGVSAFAQVIVSCLMTYMKQDHCAPKI